ncbi:MAG: hypothetical protein N2C12_06275 [Planctomycetales bacterium]
MNLLKPFSNTLVLLSACLLLTIPTGCSLLATGYWIVNPNDVAAEYDGLQEQRVAVVCQPNSTLAFQNYGVNQELAARVSEYLRANVADIEIVSQTEVNDWIDQNELQSYGAFGTAMRADSVVVIDMSEFTLTKGTSMLQGQANIEVVVYDVETEDVQHRIASINALYPPENGIPVDLANQHTSEQNFRHKFVNVLANKVSRHFYAYDSREAIKTDRFQ